MQDKTKNNRVDSINDAPFLFDNANSTNQSLPIDWEGNKSEKTDANSITSHLISCGLLPAVRIDLAPDEPIEEPQEGDIQEAPPEELTGEQLEVAQALQAELTGRIARYTPQQPGQSAKEYQDSLTKQKQEIEQEREDKVFGPATQEAFKNFLTWYEKVEVPMTTSNMASMGLEPPPGNPFQLPFNANKRTIDPDLFKQLVANRKLTFETEISKTELPSRDQMEKLKHGLDWIKQCNSLHGDAIFENESSDLDKTIAKNNLPASWRSAQYENKHAWYESASEMTDLAVRTKNHVEAMHGLFKGSSNADFPMVLPKNSSITVNLDGKKYTVKAEDVTKYRSVLLDKNSTIESVSLDLPADLRQDSPANKVKINRMRQWMDTYADTIEQTLGRHLDYLKHPERVIMYGDQELPDSDTVDIQGIFNERDELVRVANSRQEKLGPNEHFKEMNLLSYDYDVIETDDNRVIIEQTIQGWDMPFYAYQNWRYLGKEVGKPLSFTREIPKDFEKNYQPVDVSVNGQNRRLYQSKEDPKGPCYQIVEVQGINRLKEVKLNNKTDFVPMSKGGNVVEIMKAGDLKAHKSGERVAYYGEKALMVGMDALMLADAVIGTHGAVSATRVAEETGLNITTREASKLALARCLKGSVALAGVLNNAGARQHQWGRIANTARHLYFIGDIGTGLVRGGWGLVRGAKAGEALAASEKVHSVIHGTKANQIFNGSKALEGMGWIKHAHTGTHWGFKVTEYGFLPVIKKDLSNQIKSIQEIQARDPLADAQIQIGDGRGLQKPEKGSFDPKNIKAKEATENVLAGFAETLMEGGSADKRAQIKAIMDRTNELLSAEASEQDKENFREQLLAKLTFSTEEVKTLEDQRKAEIAVDGKTDEEIRKITDADFIKLIQLSDEDLHKLLDEDTRQQIHPAAVRALAEKILSAKDKDIQTAARIALIYLSRDNDGNVQQQIASMKFALPEYEREVGYKHSFDGKEWSDKKTIKVPSRSVQYSLNASEVVADLQRNVESPTAANLSIVSGDILVRLGAITHRQYAAVLQDVLSSPKTTANEKMRALVDPSGARLASIIDALRYDEDNDDRSDRSLDDKIKEIGKSFGLTSIDLLKTLETVAKDSQNADVRAMAALVHYGLCEPDVTRRQEILMAANSSWHSQNGQFDGAFARAVTIFIKNDMNVKVPDGAPANTADLIREHKLTAALALARLVDDDTTQKDCSRAIAESFSTTDPRLAARVIEHLLPTRIKHLDATQINKLRCDAVGIIKSPTSEKDEQVMVALLRRMPAILGSEPTAAASQEITDRLTDKIKQLIDPAAKDEYAKWYPEMRAQIITTLAELNVQEARPLIRRHLAAYAKLSVGDETIVAKEMDARVRLAAVNGLKRLKDPELASMAPDLISKEKDASVSATLREIKCETEMIEPTSKEWDMQEERCAERIERANEFEQLSQFNYDAARDWLSKFSIDGAQPAFDLLSLDSFQQSAKARVGEGSTLAEITRCLHPKQRCMDEEGLVVQKLSIERNEQWNKLIQLASADKVDPQTGERISEKARHCLYHIISSKSGFMGEPGHFYVEGQYFNRTNDRSVYNQDFSLMAAHALRDMALAGKPGFKHISTIVSESLANPSVNADTKIVLLDALKNLSKQNGQHKPAISRVQLATTLTDALKVEIGKVDSQSQPFQTKLIQELRDIRYRMSFPTLQAISERSKKFPEICAQAGQIVNDLRDSVTLMWEETPIDKNANGQRRADRINQILKGTKKDHGPEASAEKVIQELFNSYKGYEMNGANDPGVFALQFAMTSDNQRVQLAAAKALMESTILTSNKFSLNQPMFERACQILNDLAIHGKREGYKSDALQLLEKVKQATSHHPVADMKGLDGKTYTMEKTEFGTTLIGKDKGRVAEVKQPDGRLSTFEYEGDLLVKANLSNGNVFSRVQENGNYTDKWTDSQKKSYTSITVTPKGEFVASGTADSITTTYNPDSTVKNTADSGMAITRLGNRVVHVTTPAQSSAGRVERHFAYNDKGDLVHVNLNGNKYSRQRAADGSFTDSWQNDANPNQHFNGTFTIHDNGDHSWQGFRDPDCYRYKANGEVEKTTDYKTAMYNFTYNRN
ncbi:MAG: hypothetical protein K2X93_23830 [Candidatus Obscuribacterales bacterium]|nr:hypothetical protein [Candidatus Obscuribacterales bacterium]